MGVRSWLSGLRYKSVFVHSNYQQSAFFGKFFLLWFFVDGNPTKVSFFGNSAWTMTKALCLNPMAALACYSFFWLSYFCHDIKNMVNVIQRFTKTNYFPLSVSVTISNLSEISIGIIFTITGILHKTLSLKAPL